MSHTVWIRGHRGTGGWQRCGLGLACLIVAGAVWLPLAHRVFRCDLAEYRSADGIPPRAARLAERHIRLWADPEQRRQATAALRACNPEWDLMARSYLVLALANMALREPAGQDAHLTRIDRILDDTLAAEEQHGPLYFLLPYARAQPFTLAPVRSHHVDSQIGLMLAARCFLERDDRYDRLLRERVGIMRRRMEAGPMLAGESYPDECWTYDVVNGLAVMRMADALVGTDHTDLRQRWLVLARERLVDSETKLLISSFTYSGAHLDGPEGSTIWMVAHALQLVDAEFAVDQYQRARHELARRLLGFGYAGEWPSSWTGPSDVDSGPPIPGLDISAGSSGTALIAASAFDDHAYLAELLTTLQFGGFPREEAGALQYCASNELGDAVLLYATVLGPLWDRAQAGGEP